MSLLNIANDGIYNVLISIITALYLEGDTEREKLVHICSNKENDSKKRINQTLLRWEQLGLFIDDDGIIRFCENVKKIARNDNIDKFRTDIKSEIRSIVFESNNNKHFWDNEKTKSADFTRSLSWVLAQDIYHFSLSNIDKVQNVESKQLRDVNKRPIRNDVRLNGFKVWANYLGFTSQFKDLMIDPTEAIKQELLSLCKKNKEYPVDDFLELLANRIPVIDGGVFRLKVEKELDSQHWRGPSTPEILSTSLSRALWRLELSGHLELVSKSDAGKNRVIQRQRSQPDRDRSFTHVVFRGED